MDPTGAGGEGTICFHCYGFRVSFWAYLVFLISGGAHDEAEMAAAIQGMMLQMVNDLRYILDSFEEVGAISSCLFSLSFSKQSSNRLRIK